jgi:hypothetical protein
MPGSEGSNESNTTEHNNELFSLSKRLTALLNFYIKSSANNFKEYLKKNKTKKKSEISPKTGFTFFLQD